MGGYQPRHLADSGPAPSAGRRGALAGTVLVGVAVVLGVISATRPEADPALEAGTPAPAPARSQSLTSSAPTSTTTVTTTLPPRRAATIAFTGDVLIHSQVWEAARSPSGPDFTPMLAPIAPQLAAADLAICHLEVTLARPEDQPSSYPRFRAPHDLAGSLAASGFDGCSVASNHALDFGEQGVVATLDALDAADLRHTGTARSPEEGQAPAWYEAGGIRVAQLSYAYGFNGLRPPAGKEWLVDQIDPALILADASAARENGADLVVVSLHWGNEYAHDVTEGQRTVADALAAVPGAVDLVVGHHAHVVQPISKVGDLWVVWGMGNLLSNNTPRCCLDEVTDGVVVTATIGDLVEPGGVVGVTGITFTPTWNERDTFRVLPAAAELATRATTGAPADALRASYERTVLHILALGAAELGVAPDRTPPPA